MQNEELRSAAVSETSRSNSRVASCGKWNERHERSSRIGGTAAGTAAVRKPIRAQSMAKRGSTALEQTFNF